VLNKHLKTIREYLDEQHLLFSAKNRSDFWTSTHTVGWHSPRCFVLPETVIGDHNGVWFAGIGETAQYISSGTLKGWNNQVATHAKANPYKGSESG
jgi:hypothetical protein